MSITPNTFDRLAEYMDAYLADAPRHAEDYGINMQLTWDAWFESLMHQYGIDEQDLITHKGKEAFLRKLTTEETFCLMVFAGDTGELAAAGQALGGSQLIKKIYNYYTTEVACRCPETSLSKKEEWILQHSVRFLEQLKQTYGTKISFYAPTYKPEANVSWHQVKQEATQFHNQLILFSHQWQNL